MPLSVAPLSCEMRKHALGTMTEPDGGCARFRGPPRHPEHFTVPAAMPDAYSPNSRNESRKRLASALVLLPIGPAEATR